MPLTDLLKIAQNRKVAPAYQLNLPLELHGAQSADDFYRVGSFKRGVQKDEVGLLAGRRCECAFCILEPLNFTV